MENRDDCPCYLYFDIANASLLDASSEVYATALTYPEQETWEVAGTTVGELASRAFGFTLRHSGSWNGYAVTGHGRSMLLSQTKWVVPEGSDFDPLYRFAFETEGFEEEKVHPVEFIKEHARVLVRFTNADRLFGDGEGFPFEVIVRSNTRGIDALSGAPVTGAFEHRPGPEEGNAFRFILPRQADRSLVMELRAKDGLPVEGLTEVVGLWDILSGKGGIDWTEKNLPDVTVEIEYGTADVTVEVTDWNGDTTLPQPETIK